MMTAFYSNKIADYSLKEEALKKSSNRISTLRLVTFLSGAVLSYFFFAKLSVGLGWIAVFITIAGFLFLVKKHASVNNELDRTRCKIQINQDYLDRLSGKWIEFKEKGQDFVDPGHPFTLDLDIFGDKSLYQYLNITRTFYGRKKLADVISNPKASPVDIKRRQNAVKELSAKVDFSQELQCEGRLNKKVGGDPMPLITQAEDGKTLFKSKWLENLFYLLPALTILSIVFSNLNALIPPFIPTVLILIQLIIYAVGFRKTADILSDVGKFKKDIMVYGNIIRQIEEESFEDGYLEELKKHYKSSSKTTSKKVKRLEHIAEAVDIRFSPLLHFLLNLFLLWDYHCIFALEDWKEKNGKSIRSWIETIGEFESLLSLAVLLQTHPSWIFPDVVSCVPVFSARELGHPLISDEKRVCNDVEIKNELCVITGSNMSGKTTLLRTIGINLVLAYSGAPVCAGMMHCSIMEIYTSMRITDDLNSGISTFYAELLRIKLIIDSSKARRNMIFLIDELFRGTNSKDRIIGAIHVLKALNKEWIIGLISTHDFELCELEEESRDRIKNYHFTETYENNKIHFDYKLRKGRSTTTNARYLMKMVGIDLES